VVAVPVGPRCRRAYLGIANALTMLRLLPMSDQAKDAEILALRHQIAVLERQLRGGQIRFEPSDRVFLAAPRTDFPRDVLRRIRLLVRPEPVLRWPRDLVARHHPAISRPRRVGGPPTVRSIRTLVLHLARENSGWGYRRIHGELLVPGIKIAASTVWEILRDGDRASGGGFTLRVGIRDGARRGNGLDLRRPGRPAGRVASRR